MKKLILIILCLFLCGCTKNTAMDTVKEYFELFKTKDNQVTVSLKELIKNENLLKEQQELYYKVMEKQYENFTYEIKNIIYNGNSASIDVEITVFDYVKSKEDAYHFYQTNQSTDYKQLQLEFMERETEKRTYEMEFSAIYEENKWVLETPDYTILQKIQGIYEG